MDALLEKLGLTSTNALIGLALARILGFMIIFLPASIRDAARAKDALEKAKKKAQPPLDREEAEP